MANVSEVKNQLEKATAPTDLRSLIEKSAKELARALPDHMRPERLVRIALTCLRTNPELAKCTPESFLGSLFVAAQIGVEPVAGQAYLLPFNNKRKVNGEWKTVKECQFVLGYKGLATLFYRHEKAVLISWGIVHEKDDFVFEYGTNAVLKHKPATGERGPVIGYYVIANLQGGGKPFLYWTREECLAHAQKFSKTFDREKKQFYSSSPWATAFDSMALKTCLLQLGKLLPLSVEIQRAMQADETSRDYKSGIEDTLDLPTTTNWDESEPFDGEPIPAGDAKAEAAKPVSKGAIIEKTTRKDLGNGITRTFIYVDGQKYFSDDIQTGVALNALKEAGTKVLISADDKEIDGARKIVEVEPCK